MQNAERGEPGSLVTTNRANSESGLLQDVRTGFMSKSLAIHKHLVVGDFDDRTLVKNRTHTGDTDSMNNLSTSFDRMVQSVT